MPLRDILLFALIFGSLPFILRRPWIGVIVGAWLGYMNPHRYTWGAAFSYSFVAIVAVVTIISFVLSSEKKELPKDIIVTLLFCFLAWVTLTTFTALNPLGAKVEWSRFYKIQILNFLALYLLQNRQRINWLVTVIVVSIGFYAFKGGIFTIQTGGIYRVGGPVYSFIGGNTEIGFASTVIMPLMIYLWFIADRKLIKGFLTVAIILSIIGIFGTHSRGAFLAFGVLCAYFCLVSRRKYLVVLMICCLPVLLSVMPEKFFDRMESIQNYQEDASATGRINAWKFAYNLAKDRPIVGGGANAFTPGLFARYAPEPERVHDSHSIYFEILGEQGFPGLLLFIAILFFSFRNCAEVKKKSREVVNLKWAYDLSRMLQASFVAYAVGGAFLGLAYFDLLYHLVALTVLLRLVVNRELQVNSANIPEDKKAAENELLLS